MPETQLSAIRLSPHFTLLEAVRSSTALRVGIDNTPSPDIIVNLKRTAVKILEPVREHFGVPFSPSSWFRCDKLNAYLKGSKTSDHPKGFSVDFEVPGVDNLTLAKAVQELCDFDQLILEFHDPAEPHSGWVHASYRSAAENRREVLRTMDGVTYFTGLEG